MSEASNDKRIWDLFKKGLHHHKWSDMSSTKFILSGERKSHHKLECQFSFIVIRQPKGPAISHGGQMYQDQSEKC